MKLLSTAALGAALVAMISTIAVAEKTDGPCPASADTPQLLRCALGHSERVARARGDVEAVRGRRLTAAHLFPANPTVEIALGRREADAGQVELDRGIEVSQQIEIGGQRGARLDVVRSEEVSARVALQAAEQEIVVDVLESVIAVARARAGAQFAAEERDLAERLVEVSAGRAQRGVGAALDVELAEAARIQARRGEVAAARSLREAQAGLALAVGADVKLVEGATPPGGFAPDVGLPELERRALAQRQTLQAPQAEAQGARARLELLRRERVPDLTLAAFYKHEEQSDVLGGRLSIPLPLLRRNQGEIAEEQARIGQAEATTAQGELRVRLEVRSAHDAWERSVAVAKEIPPELEDRLAADVLALRDAYARGALPLTSALASLREIFAARRTLVDVRADAVVTSLELARATASPISVPASGGRP